MNHSVFPEGRSAWPCPLHLCFSDTAAAFRVVLPPSSGEQAFVSKMQEMVRKKYHEWITRMAQRGNIPSREIQALQQISIHVRFARNSLGSIAGTTMTIDEGNLLVGYALAYATAKIEHQQVSLDVFNVWHDYFLDSVVAEDPLVHVDGAAAFHTFILSSGGLDQALRETFIAHLNSWLALTVLHEAAHFLLGHDDRWRHTFPELRGAPVDTWSPHHFAFSHALELEADTKALDLYMVGAGYHPGAAIPSWIEWQVVRREALRRRPLVIYPTHPEPEERATALLAHVAELCELPHDDREKLINAARRVLQQLTRDIQAGVLRPVPQMRGQRPPSVTPNLERFFLRDTQLRLLAGSNAKSRAE